MSDKIEEIKEIMEESNSRKIVVFTNHLKIVGTVAECEKCNDKHYLNLRDVTVLDISELYPCEDDDSCGEFSSQKFDWLHVSVKKILAFSFV